MDAVIEVNVSVARRMTRDEMSRARAKKRVTGRVVFCGISLGFDDSPDASIPFKIATDQIARTIDGISPEKLRAYSFLLHRPVGWSMKAQGRLNRPANSVANTFTPKVSVA